MGKKNSLLSKAKDVLYKKAIIKSHADYGKSPKDLDFNKNNISRIDVGAEIGKYSVKCFYRNSKKCFYYDIAEIHLERWLNIIKELYQYDDFLEDEEPTTHLGSNNNQKSNSDEENRGKEVIAGW